MFKKEEMQDWIKMSACFGASTPMIFPLIFVPAELKTHGKIASDIYDNRLLRLQAKVRDLERRILNTLDEEEREQLQIAKDFFELKRVLYFTKKTNKIDINVNEKNN